ncbi:MAG: hypothetical protein ACRC8W_02625 [Plesiomonas shigelloides]
MSLSEGKMFTIEALNRIDGFVWPDKSMFASMDMSPKYVFFYSSAPVGHDTMFNGKGLLDKYSTTVAYAHPDWRSSLITREEFESVDGWVRNDESMLSSSALIDIKTFNGVVNSKVRYESNFKKYGNAFDIEFWRYHKPQKQEVKPEPESIETMIRRYKDAKENRRAAIDRLNQAQADVEQAEALEDSLFMAIEAWAESHGFDIRVLSESEERFTLNADIPMPENPIPLHASSLVITDWRDLRVGDIIEYTDGLAKSKIGMTGPVTSFALDAHDGMFVRMECDNGENKGREGWPLKWKFIRRPEKK